MMYLTNRTILILCNWENNGLLYLLQRIIILEIGMQNGHVQNVINRVAIPGLITVLALHHPEDD